MKVPITNHWYDFSELRRLLLMRRASAKDFGSNSPITGSSSAVKQDHASVCEVCGRLLVSKICFITFFFTNDNNDDGRYVV